MFTNAECKALPAIAGAMDAIHLAQDRFVRGATLTAAHHAERARGKLVGFVTQVAVVAAERDIEEGE